VVSCAAVGTVYFGQLDAGHDAVHSATIGLSVGDRPVRVVGRGRTGPPRRPVRTVVAPETEMASAGR
jgi:hypothetical protein